MWDTLNQYVGEKVEAIVFSEGKQEVIKHVLLDVLDNSIAIGPIRYPNPYRALGDIYIIEIKNSDGERIFKYCPDKIYFVGRDNGDLNAFVNNPKVGLANASLNVNDFTAALVKMAEDTGDKELVEINCVARDITKLLQDNRRISLFHTELSREYKTKVKKSIDLLMEELGPVIEHRKIIDAGVSDSEKFGMKAYAEKLLGTAASVLMARDYEQIA